MLFAGIDGSGKSTCLDGLVDRLEGELRVLRIGVDGFELFHRGTHRQLVSSERMEAVGDRVRGTFLYGFWLMANFARKMFFSRYYEWFGDYDVVMFETDTLLNPSVYIAYHFPWLDRFLPARRRFALLSALFGAPRHTLILYLEVTPEVGLARCERREAEEGYAIEPHENLDDLRVLAATFEEVVAAARRKGYALESIATDALSEKEMIDAAERVVRARLAPASP